MNATIPALLAHRAETSPYAPFVRFRSATLSYAEMYAGARTVAHGLRRLGVGCDDLVAVLLPNGPAFFKTWFGTTLLDAVHAPVNTAFRGPGLAHVLNLTRASVLVADETLCDALEPIADELDAIRHVVVHGDPTLVAPRFPGWRVSGFEEFEHAEDAPVLRPVADASALAMLLFTSGTTGRSKACMLSHRYAVRQAELMVENLGLRADDVLYCPFPLFHADAAIFTVMSALVLGAAAAIGERFSASAFWDEVRAFGATVFDFMGATLTMLHEREPRPDDADNPIRLAWGVPMPAFAAEFERRFDLRLIELYGSTDAGIPIYSPLDEPRRPGACGKVVDPYQVRLVDEHDEAVAVGKVGEMAIRSREPSVLMDGYFGMPEETAAAFRGGWFHTGDLARQDADGWISFVGRRKDTIRRRGENISAFEVEEVIGGHPAVLEVAAYGVPSELTEEDVMVAVVPRPGTEPFDVDDLIAYCEQRMAGHMVPRYIDVVNALPRTPTEKIEKHWLIQRGATPTTWDRIRPDART